MKIDKETLEIADVHFWGENSKSKGGMKIEWSCNLGFGEMCFIKGEDGEYAALTECMCINEDKEFIEMILEKFKEMLNVIN